MNPQHRVHTIIPSKSFVAQSFKPPTSTSEAQDRPLCSPHFDRIAVFGGLHHKPIGELFYKLYEDAPVAVGSAAFKPNRSRAPDDVYIRSRDIEGRSNPMANKLEFNCCPPQILQGHNFFGHNSLQDYVTAIFEQQVDKFNLRPSAEERHRWHYGDVDLSHVHLCANFWFPEGSQRMAIDAIDANNVEGKHRDDETCISLGYNGDSRSEYRSVTAYDKHVLLSKLWKRPGHYQSRILRTSRRSFRVEIKLFRRLLKEQGLAKVRDWRNQDVSALYFKYLAAFNIANSFQPLLTPDECTGLKRGALRAYTLWLNGEDLSRHYGRTTVAKYIKEVRGTIGIDMTAHRRPEKLPPLNLTELLVPENVVPVPRWGIESGRYWWPGRAEEEYGARLLLPDEAAPEPPQIWAPDAGDFVYDEELDRLAL